MKKAILFAIITIALASFAWWAYSIIRSRYSDPAPNDGRIRIESPRPGKQEEGAAEESDSDVTPEESVEDGTNPDKEEESSLPDTTSDEPRLDITPRDCENGCRDYDTDKEELGYCRNVCGLASPNVGTVAKKKPGGATDCDQKEDLEKDYCLKDAAIDKNDFSLCEKIADPGIKAACKNRLAEDLIERQ